MFSEVARLHINKAVMTETENAKKNYGDRYNSPHEGYAVLLEEVEEAVDDLTCIKNNLAVLWQSIKTNDLDSTTLTDIEGTAQLLALEAVQIAAVCTKFKESL